MTLRDFAIDVVRTLQAAGHEAVFAGGCVRDALLGLEPADYDIATSAPPEAVQGLFRRTVAVGASFGVVEVLGPQKHKVQVATFRNDGAYIDGRRPESVQYSTAEQDAQRRDFTVNGMFLDPLADRILDYVGGQDDLQRRVLRAIGDPAARFREDKLRLLRAVRMAARFDFTIEPDTFAAIQDMASQITVVSAERIAEEMRKLLANPRRETGLKLLRQTGLLKVVLSEAEDLDAIERLPSDCDFETVLALLIADVSKARAIARRWKLSNEESSRLVWLVTHRRSLAPPLDPSRLYPILAHEGARQLIALSRALSQPEDAVATCERWLNDPRLDLDPPPLLTGDDLIRHGWTPGKIFKDVLQHVREAQLDGIVDSCGSAYELAEVLRDVEALSQVRSASKGV